MTSIVFSVPGIKCNGCVATITDTLATTQQTNPVISHFEVNLENKTVSVDSSLTADDIIKIIKSAGFDALKID